MPLSGKKVLIIAGPQYEDRELFYPYYRLLEENAEVKVAGIGESRYKGKYGIPIDVDGQTGDYTNTKWDAVIVPGGWAPDKIRADEGALAIIKKTFEAGGVVASICHGPWALASAGILKGKNVTSYKNIKDDLVNAGAKWEDKEVVVDDNLVTSRTPADLPAFMKATIKQLQLVKV